MSSSRNYSASADDALVREAQAGDMLAFEELVARHRDKVYARAYSMMRNEEEALDLSQEAWVKAWQRLQQAYSVYFSIPPEQVRRWHERIVALAEADTQWFTVAYHLEELLKAHPEDSKLRRRLADARNNAALEGLR